MGERLKQLRLENGLKLKEVATALNVTIRSINRYEDGTREPSVDLIIKFLEKRRDFAKRHDLFDGTDLSEFSHSFQTYFFVGKTASFNRFRQQP